MTVLGDRNNRTTQPDNKGTAVYEYQYVIMYCTEDTYLEITG